MVLSLKFDGLLSEKNQAKLQDIYRSYLVLKSIPIRLYSLLIYNAHRAHI